MSDNKTNRIGFSEADEMEMEKILSTPLPPDIQKKADEAKDRIYRQLAKKLGFD